MHDSIRIAECTKQPTNSLSIKHLHKLLAHPMTRHSNMDDRPRRHSASHINLKNENLPRLTLIAPKAERGSHSTQLSPGLRPKSASGIYKDKLPPRSRTGCWTCRTRKVKCDEEHPRCGQCVRLQHQCDYSPRLSFRDDTPRIIERMQEVSTLGSAVWDSSARPINTPLLRSFTDPLSDSSLDPQNLPPFSELTTDEERELKALTRRPGTFHLICNPSSFSAIDESQDESDEDGRVTPTGTKIKQEDGMVDGFRLEKIPTKQKLAISTSDQSITDPDVVILRRFEDVSLKSPVVASNSNKIKSSPVSSVPSLSGLEITTPTEVSDVPEPFLFNSVTPRDSKYYQHYKEIIVPRLLDLRGLSSVWGTSLQLGACFEKEALEFPALFHAIIALSAFSYNQSDGSATLDSLQHYQLALPSLPNSLASGVDTLGDGVLYTHFFLLLYELATVDLGRDSLWEQHLSHIKHILLSRTSPPSNDITFFIIWYILVIDVYGSLSSAMDGELTGILLKNNLVPDGKLLLETKISEDHDMQVFNSTSYGKHEIESFRKLLAFNQGLTLMGASIAKLARYFRTTPSFEDFLYPNEANILSHSMSPDVRQSQVQSTIDELKTVWFFHRQELSENDFDGAPIASMRLRVLHSQAKLFFQSCLIYAHTSMWPGQRSILDQRNAMEVVGAVSSIVEECNHIINDIESYVNLGFMGLPLFLAGYASTSAGQKMWILELLKPIESKTIGRNITVIREALQLVYQRQNEAVLQIGNSLDVDWQSILIELGIPVVTFGF